MPWKKVWRNVLLGLPGKPERAVAERALKEVGLGDHTDAWPKTLSGGEAQRASLARALVTEPRMLLADEPTGDLDAETADRVFSLIQRVHASHGLTSILVTHNQELAGRCDRVMRLEAGHMEEDLAKTGKPSRTRVGERADELSETKTAGNRGC